MAKLAFASVLLFVLACGKSGSSGAGSGGGGGGGTGDPALVKAAEEIAAKVCACPDSACLWKVKSSDGRGAEITTARGDKLTAAEKAAFEAAARKINECSAAVAAKK